MMKIDPKNLTQIMFYDRYGKEFTDDVKVNTFANNFIIKSNQKDHLSAAKHETFKLSDGKIVDYFYIKRGVVGFHSGQFYNPYDTFIDNNSALAAYDSKSDRNYYEYQKVTPEIFEIYIHFLETGNQTHLRSAERLYV